MSGRLSVYLFGGILQKMKNWEEKSEDKVFLVGVWLEGREGGKKNWWGLDVFSLGPLDFNLINLGRK